MIDSGVFSRSMRICSSDVQLDFEVDHKIVKIESIQSIEFLFRALCCIDCISCIKTWLAPKESKIFTSAYYSGVVWVTYMTAQCHSWHEKSVRFSMYVCVYFVDFFSRICSFTGVAIVVAV